MHRNSIVMRIIQINVVIFILWNLLAMEHSEFMIKNFLVSWAHVKEGRFWTLITSIFSHNMLLHIFINMYVLFNFGPVLETLMGPRSFILFFLLCGIVGSLGHCFSGAFILNEPKLMALGASGAISGVVLLFALIFPRQKIYLLGILPLPALGGAIIFITLDLLGLISQTKGINIPIGHGAHLGGACCAIIYYLVRGKKLRLKAS
jgi:membrane associated rhomboid family serine protease